MWAVDHSKMMQWTLQVVMHLLPFASCTLKLHVHADYSHHVNKLVFCILWQQSGDDAMTVTLPHVGQHFPST